MSVRAKTSLLFASLSHSSSVKRTGMAGGDLGWEDGVNSGELRGVSLDGSGVARRSRD